MSSNGQMGGDVRRERDLHLRQQMPQTVCLYKHLLFAEKLEATENTSHIPLRVHRETIIRQMNIWEEVERDSPTWRGSRQHCMSGWEVTRTLKGRSTLIFSQLGDG